MPPAPDNRNQGRVAGVDFGTVRIGVAISDPARVLASPLKNFTRCGPEGDARFFRQLASDEEITLWVVGLPVHLSGLESQKSIEARKFGRWIEELTDVPVEFFDERFTSIEAEQFLAAGELTSKKRKKRRDMLAAQIMLSAYLESSGKGQTDPGALDD